jgi:hypothetical protein
MFVNGKGLTNYGTLSAIGTPASPIVFTSSATTPTNGIWGGLVVSGGSLPQASLNNVEIAYAQYGLLINPFSDIDVTDEIVLSQSSIHNSLFDAVQIYTMINYYFHAQAVQVISNTLSQNGRYGVYLHASASGCSDTTNYGAFNSSTVQCNEIFGNANAGIQLQGDANGLYGACSSPRIAAIYGTISDNFIHGNLYGINAIAYSDGVPGSVFHNWGRIQPLIANNIIVNNQRDGISLSNVLGADLLPSIVNNTIFGNGGSAIYHSVNFTNSEWKKTDATNRFIIENNLMIQNQWGIQAQFPFTTASASINGTNILVLSNNDVWGNWNANWVDYTNSYGNPTATNLNGSLADAYADISADPLFISSSSYQLQATSPAIDAGTTNGTPTNDIAGVRRGAFPDLGAYEFDSLLLTPNLPPSQGRFGFTVTGGRGTAFTIDTSSNLQTWTAGTNATLTNRTLLLQIPLATNAPQMFYRGQVK